jgi:2-keto-4-pentenoate hydratase
MSGLDYAAAARTLRSARREGRTLDVLLSSERGLSLADAYRVQDQVTALRLAGGERRAGWKLGYTSAVMRAQMGIDAPNFGPLTDAMLLDSPAVLPTGALQPRIEPEIGLRLGRRLAGPCSVSEVLDACDAALACLEVVDSVWSGYRFTLEDNTADGSSAAWVVVGPVMPVSDLAALPVTLSVDGEVVESGTGAAVSGHPASGVAWLAEQLAERGRALEPGDLVITGGLTSAHPLEPGHRISASFGDGRWLAEVRRAATGLRSLCRTGKGGLVTTGSPEERDLDREQAISALKAAFVQGRLTSDEFDARVGQALTSRTRAELAAITADIPVGPIGVQPVRRPDQPALGVKSGVCVTASAAVLAVALWAAAWSAGSAAAGAAALAVSGVVIFTLFVTGYQVRESRHRSRPARPLPPGTAS